MRAGWGAPATRSCPRVWSVGWWAAPAPSLSAAYAETSDCLLVCVFCSLLCPTSVPTFSVVTSNFVNLYRLRRNLRHSNETGSIRYIRKYSDMWWTTPEATERRRPGLWTPWRARTAPGARTRGVDENPAELLACWCGGWVGAGGPATRAHRRSDQEAGAEAWQRGERQEQLAARCWAARLHLACVWLREAGRSRACTRGRPCPGRHCRRHPCCFARARSVAPVLQRLTAVSCVCVSSRGACACADGQASAMN